ncbi:hypothetical protein HMSSN139_07260 [Paenibacillus sp. HMSSN-139]|nr:hypothetical protein HMSSN139_07260 [Paenibacillus sp. HMSSN-139]
MDKNIKQNTPKLRFSGFKGPWRSTTLGHHVKEYRKLKEGGGSIPIATSSRRGLFLQGEYYSGDRSYVNEDIQFKIVPRGFITYRHMSDDSIFHFNINNIADEVLVSPEYPVFTTNDTMSTLFIHKYLNSSKRFRKFCEMQKLGGTRTRLYFNKLVQFSLYLPSIEEQQKIAAFFSLLDQKIDKQQEKIDQLELFKKGMLQKIFSQEIRFKDENGQEFPEWGTVKLGDLGETYGGLSGKTKDDFGDGECSFITYMNVFTNTVAKIDGLEKVSIGANENQHKVLAGDILFTTSSETPEEVGMASVWSHEIPNVYLNSFCFGFRLSKPIDPIFLAYLLRSGGYRKHITMLAQGSTRYNLSKSNLMKMELSIPVNEEQKLIRDFFVKLDIKLAKRD